MEIALTADLVLPSARAAAALGAGALFLVYLVPHADAFRHVSRATTWHDRPVGVAVRLAVNLGYAAWAFAVAREFLR
ncbi:hypothetical protein [Streptomyces sp. RPT161]|uniref:hypothetical protein n=1 Tax=Streptomyces sp. RPT161 TaxID=3015993 RepID=UPI0022B916BD|nr:hypothetical protein [Streptomyces sp. RPT161]